MIKVKENGRYKLVNSKEILHYMYKLLKDLKENLDEKSANMTYGELTAMWYRDYLDIEEIIREISWTQAEHFILKIAGIIKKDTSDCLDELTDKIYNDIWNMPI